MARRIKANRIKKNLTYTITEAADELEVSTATIRNWGKRGLPIQTEQRPYLIFGEDLREFIAQRRASKKFSLQDGELSCFTCNAGRRPLNDAVVYVPQTAKTGRLSGVCGTCGGKCARIISNAKLGVYAQLLKIQFGDGGAP
ncbi:MAG: helix-turn-helix domain-containing protein [Rhodobacterales bacterium]|nr:helix-turn-helix domain-containing protein [Rhodobacterales bacterium]